MRVGPKGTSEMSSTTFDGRQEDRGDRVISVQTEDKSPRSPSEDDLFGVLSNRRRRFTVHALKDEEGATKLGDVAEQVAAWEYDVDIEQLSYNERKRVYTALQQSHLPMMNDVGIVEFDKNRGVVKPTDFLDDIEVYMEVVHGNEIPWAVYYLGLSGIAASLMLATGVGAWPFVLLPDVAWGIAITVMFTVSAVIHTYFARGQRIGEQEKPPELRRE